MSAHYSIRLVDEFCKLLDKADDTAGFVDTVLVPYAQARQGLVRHIDPYGKTSFNEFQCEAILEEIGDLIRNESSGPHALLLQKLVELLQRAASEVHLHVVFLGD